MREQKHRVVFVVAAAIFLMAPTCCSHPHMAMNGESREYRTRTGRTILVSETHPVGRSLSTIEVRTRGFEHEFQEVFPDRDPISDVFMADLDGNGFDEVYIITISAGSGGYGSVLGFASNQDKSLSLIHFPDMRKGDAHFEGYMGHDTFRIEDRKLVRTFPIFAPGDTNGNPTGGRRRLVYGLYSGEAGWQLKVEKAEELPAFSDEDEIRLSRKGDFPQSTARATAGESAPGGVRRDR